MAAILNFIADHPGQAFTLTDLVKALKLSRATCHALLTGLVEVGYLYRAGDKSHILGPALASIGRVASQHASPLQVSQPEMRLLADQFDVVCAAFFRDRNEITVRDRASSVSNFGLMVPVGTRLKMSPTFGADFNAWLPQPEVDAWLEGYDPPITPERRALVMAGMAFMREHRFQVHIRNPGTIDAARDQGRAYSDDTVVYPTLQLAGFENTMDYQVDAIVSPVFELRGQIAFMLGLVGFNRTVSGKELWVMGTQLREACERISSFITGRPARSGVSIA
jgi:DNA-binding IclR family transcriptional regulator